MIDLNTAAVYWLCPEPIDMRKGRDRLAAFVRDKTGTDPINGSQAFIFYSKNLRVVKILHHDFSGYELYTKYEMVRRWKIPEAGVRQHQPDTLDNEIPTAAVPDRGSADTACDNMTTPLMSKYRAAYELGQSTLNGRKLVHEAYRWIITHREELVRWLEDGSISREELEAEKAEIRQTEQQLKALFQQIEASEKSDEKVFKNR